MKYYCITNGLLLADLQAIDELRAPTEVYTQTLFFLNSGGCWSTRIYWLKLVELEGYEEVSPDEFVEKFTVFCTVKKLKGKNQ